MRNIITCLYMTGSLLFGNFYSNAQQPIGPQAPKIVSPSPNAFAFSKYGNIPISPYNGLPNISIPVYDISYRDIVVPINLTYHASGIKVSEEASRVGLGWVLNAGGVISRNVINKDDLQFDPNSYLGSAGGSTAPVIPNGPFSSPYAAIQTDFTYKHMDPQNSGSTISLNLTDYAAQDFEPDIFSYNFGGNSGTFILSRTGDTILEKQAKIQLKLSADRNTWQVTTADGYVYKFLDSETFVDYDNTSGYAQKSAWYLSEIASPTGATIKFYYKNLGTNLIRPVGSYYERQHQLFGGCSGFPCTYRPGVANPVPAKNYSNIALDSIGWNTGRIIFNYANDRLDTDGDLRLTSVQIIKKKNITPSEEIVFVHDYFVGLSGSPLSPQHFPTQFADKAAKRLKLSGMTRRSLPVTTTSPTEQYTFEYYENSNQPFPPKNSFSRDHWGYYNGKSNTSMLPKYTTVSSSNINLQQLVGVMGTEKDPSAEYMHLLSLKSIVYPTKGKTTFYYEPHDFEYTTESGGGEQSEPEAYQLTESVIYNTNNKGVDQYVLLDLRDEYLDQQGNVVPVTFRGAFRTNMSIPCNQIGSANVRFEIVNEAKTMTMGSVITPNGVTCTPPADDGCITCLTGSMVFDYKGSVVLPPGKYYWKAYMESSETRIVDISAMYTWTVDAKKRAPGMTEPDGSIKKYKLAGGLRINRVEDFDPETGKVSNIRRYDYHYSTDANNDGVLEIHSYGKRQVKPAYSYYDVSWESRIDPISGSVIQCTQCMTLVRDSGHPQANYSGPSVGYSQVKELQGLNGENGYTIYEYDNNENQMLAFNNPYVPAVSLQPPAVNSLKNPSNGNLLRQTVYTSTGTKVMTTENIFSTVNNNVPYGLTMRWLVADGNVWGGLTNAHLMMAYPAVSSYFSYMRETRSINYSPTGIETNKYRKEFAYESLAHLQLTKEISYESDQHKTITHYKYALDYNTAQSSAAVTNMKDKFMHRLPVQVTVLDENATGTQSIKSREFTIYENLPSGATLPTQKYLLQNATLTSATTPEYIPSATFDTTLYKSVFNLGYNNYGNINKVQNKSDIPIAYLWGHKESFPIAEIKNATAAQCFFTSFEEDGDLFTDASGNIARTGVRVKSNASYTFPSTFTPVVSNTVMSYWYYQSGQWIFSGVLPYTSTISTPGTKIDEVRAYPKWAQMTTFSYLPEIGLTSINDAKNLTTNYEYDEMSRLRLIRDKDKRILKSFNYVFKK